MSFGWLVLWLGLCCSLHFCRVVSLCLLGRFCGVLWLPALVRFVCLGLGC